jgi:hypothetical protein
MCLPHQTSIPINNKDLTTDLIKESGQFYSISCSWWQTFTIITVLKQKIYLYYSSPHNEHRSSQPKTSKTLLAPVNFSSFNLELYKNKFKNFIWTSKFKFSFRGLIYWKLKMLWWTLALFTWWIVTQSVLDIWHWW